MTIKEKIDADIKTAMLAGEKTLVTTLRGLKSVFLYEEVAGGNRDQGVSDEMAISLLTKEAKKRQESADLYKQGGNDERAEAELAEKKVIEGYLPAQLSDEDLGKIIDQAVEELGGASKENMGQLIGKVKQLTAGKADGGRIAMAVKERIT